MVDAIPAGCNTVTAYLVLKNSLEALEFYAKAFGTETTLVMPGANGEGCLHAEMKFGNSTVMMTDENPQFQMLAPDGLAGTAVSMHVYVEDVDAAFAQATEAGCQTIFPPTDMFWGDRFCKVADPFGHVWSLATHVEDVSEEDMATRHAEFVKQMAAADGGQ